MYEAHYGFRERPFSLIPDPDFLYLSRSHKMAISLLQYGLIDQTGFVVVTGEVGSGKTTLIRQLLRTAAADLRVGLITNTHPSLGDLMGWILEAFDIPATGSDDIERYRRFMDHVIEQYGQGKRTVLIIDEAQNLSASALERVRMLSNVNVDRHFVLQLILVGQQELKETLKRTDLRQFAQRVSVFHDLSTLTPADTWGYIKHRLRVAGGSPDIFDVAACAIVHHYTLGTPRLINILCDLALVIGFAEDRFDIDADLVLEAVDTRQSTGLEVFRKDAVRLPRDERKRTILLEVAREWPQLTELWQPNA